MEEEATVKEVPAPVTRLRRRLSVESDEVSSAPSTPSKKRGGRLAAKPQLGYIDENAPISSPRISRRKSVTKDIIEDEKPLTPSRRSTRLRSNTSLTSETIPNADTPRAKRAARRHSQVGSDTEMSITPARQTRKTRKASTSSEENQAEPVSKTGLQLSEDTITEEPEDQKKLTPEKTKMESEATQVARKSPRLASKNANESLNKSDSESNANLKSLDTSKKNQKDSPLKLTPIKKESPKPASKTMDSLNKSDSESNASFKSLNSSKKKQKESPFKLSPTRKESPKPASKIMESLNKSDSESNASFKSLNTSKKNQNDSPIKQTPIRTKINNSNELSNPDLKIITTNKTKTDRKRTKSWTTVSETSPDPNFKGIKRNVRNKSYNSAKTEDDIGAGDALNNKTNGGALVPKLSDDKENHFADGTKNVSNISIHNGKDEINKEHDKIKRPIKSDNTNMSLNYSSEKHNSSKKQISLSGEISDLFNSASKIEEIQCKVYVENTDSNSSNPEKPSEDVSKQNRDTEDQCVPIINQNSYTEDKSDLIPNANLNDSSKSVFPIIVNNKSLNHSSEPMDIDGTIPDIIITTDKSMECNEVISSKTEETIDKNTTNIQNKSEIKSDLQQSQQQTSIQHEKSSNENKSTLILSQLKDDSNIESKSPVIKQNNEEAVSLNISLSKKSRKSIPKPETPLKHKDLQKIGMQTSTPVAIPNKKINTSNKIVKEDEEMSITSSESSSEEEQSSKDKSNFLNNEASDAGDDYESGDSRDDSELRYEEENEIVEKGETLTSSDEMSNDTDYEKDSFVVSSDEEDNELLSGSGDDLAMSDNELSMSAKSKRKYNERKIKQQKNASREMYESRHKIKRDSLTNLEIDNEEPFKKKKHNRQRLDSSALTSGDEAFKVTKKNRQRLNSSTTNSEQNESKINKSKVTEESLNQSGTNEPEITAIADASMTEKHDPLQTTVNPEAMASQKFDISTVNISIKPEIEEVNVGDNATMLNINETSDPLRNDDIDEDSISSVDENIIHNYDSVLKELSQKPKKNIKVTDTSLNLKKPKKKKDASIIENLNLTQTRVNEKQLTSEKNNDERKHNEFSDESSESSESIDLKLLFSDSGNENEQTVNNDFIPLKKTESKTNIRESLSTAEDSNKSITNKTPKKTKHQDKENSKKSSEKKKRESVSHNNLERVQDTSCVNSGNETIEEIYNKNSNHLLESNKKKKNRKTSENNHTINNSSLVESTTEKEISSLDSSFKKKNRNLSESLNYSSSITSKQEKKKNRSMSESLQHDTSDVLNISNKKKSKKLSESSQKLSESMADTSTNKIQAETCIETNNANESISVESSKKKRNKSESFTVPQDVSCTQANLDTLTRTPGSATKNRKGDKAVTGDGEVKDDDANTSIQNSTRLSLSSSNENKLQDVEGPTMDETQHKTSKKRKRSSIVGDLPTKETVDPEGIQENEVDNISHQNKKKKKKDTRQNVSAEEVPDTLEADVHEAVMDISHKNKKKRKKDAEQNISGDIDNVENLAGPRFSDNIGSTAIDKKVKPVEFGNGLANQTNSNQNSRKNKKRKHHDDPEDKNCKAMKHNILDNINISRLPNTLLEKLQGNSSVQRVPDTSQTVSTSNFTVSEINRRKLGKPSHYLEESVYLDIDDDDKGKKTKKNIAKPKVLPYTPSISTSTCGFTTCFKVDVTSKETKFTARLNDVSNFKDDYINKKKVKKFGTYEMYNKKQRNIRLSKF